MSPATPSPSDPLRPAGAPRQLPSRTAAMRRRAMQAAMASAMRELRSHRGRRPGPPGSFGSPPAGQA